MPTEHSGSLPIVVPFPQAVLCFKGIQVITSTDQLFNHVDENLPIWSSYGDRKATHSISFSKPFQSIPAVTLGLSGVDCATDTNFRFWLHARHITRFGFIIEFSTWYDTHIARAGVIWQAIGPTPENEALI